MKTIKSLVGEAYEERLFLQSLDKGSQKTKSLMFFGAISLSFVMLIFLGVYSLGFWFAKWLVINKDYDAGVVVGTFFCFIIGGSSIGQISPVLKNVMEGRVAVQKLYDLMERKKTLNEKVEKGQKIKSVESIEFSGVTFGYRKVNLEGDGLDSNANSE
jgi:ABC-type multidrug transport system fused ATPase/permease subunit